MCVVLKRCLLIIKFSGGTRHQAWIAGTLKAETSLCTKELLFSVKIILLYIQYDFIHTFTSPYLKSSQQILEKV